MRLILTVEPVRRGLPAGSPAGPNVHVVYATDTGEVVSLGGRKLTVRESLRSGFRTRYDIDTGDHRCVVDLRDTPLPSRDGGTFAGTVTVGFRVHDPVAVVRNLVNDPLPVLHSFLATRLPSITRGHDGVLAEGAIAAALHGEVRLPQGLTIFSVEPRLTPLRWDHQRPALAERRPSREDLDEIRRHLSERARHEFERDDVALEEPPLWPVGEPGGATEAPWGSAAPTGSAAPPPEEDSGDLVRFLVGELPTTVRVGQEFSLVARISLDEPWPGIAAAPLSGFPAHGDGVDVIFLVQPDFGIRGEELQATVRVPARAGSPPVRFGLRAHEVGLRHLRLSAWIGGTQLAELSLEISAETHAAGERTQRRQAPVPELTSRPGDVTLQVAFDGSRYSFQIASSRYWSEQVVARSLTDAPGQAVERTVDMLRRFAGGRTAYSPAAARRWIRETGVGLWQDLVPDQIKDAFWELHDDIATFTVAGADDVVPWELLHPLTRTRDDGFLVEQFPVVRRVLGQRAAATVCVDDPRFVVPGKSPANAREEADRLHRVLRQGDGPAYVSHLDELMDLLDGPGVGLLHFACHNSFSAQQGGSAIAMEGGAFVPLMLNSTAERRGLADRHPLVFVNACRSAGVAPEYTRMTGWASQFMRAGAGAFVGTLWPVSSDRAAGFAEAFYAQLTGGTPLGTASLLARRAIADPADPTWLAYTTYGDPAATVDRAVR